MGQLGSLVCGVLLVFTGVCCAQYTDPHCEGKQVIVHLFEWKWTDIALECERLLSKKGFCGVQVSPVNEHIVKTDPPRPWWERYQPISYKLESRGGTEAELIDMVHRCKAVGVRIYVDVVINHMAGINQNGTGNAGSYFNADTFNFTGVPYTEEHFNPFCDLDPPNDTQVIKNCYIWGLTDLNQTHEYVRGQLVDFLNKLINIGVAGFRVDAAKHMWVSDLEVIQNRLTDMPEGGRPFFYHEVVDFNDGPVKTSQYTSIGYATEFRYCKTVKDGIEDFSRLDDVVDYNLGMTDSDHALVFVDNHDSERDHGTTITFEEPIKYKMAVAFLLANDYGFAKVMSSYYFGGNFNLGPPHYANYTTKTVPVDAKNETSCGNDWVCEHRWRPVANMVAFRNAVDGTTKQNYYNQNNQLAFSRGNKGFFAMARDGYMNVTLQTGLPTGSYCDLITDCAKTITVDKNGEAQIIIDNPDEPILAFIVGYQISTSTTASNQYGNHTIYSTTSNITTNVPYTTTFPFNSTNVPYTTTFPFNTTTFPFNTTTFPFNTTTFFNNTTTFPNNNTTFPNNTTPYPYNTTTFPNNTTTFPNNTTTFPNNTTTFPYNTMTFPNNTTTFPYNTTTLPNNTMTFPNNTTTFPNNKTTFPNNTTTFFNNTTTFPYNITTLHNNTTTFPNNTTAFPNNTTTFPYNTTTLPYNTTTFPYNITTLPYNTTTFPFYTTTFPYNTTTFPNNTTTFPYNTSTFPYNTTTFPYKTTTFPNNNTTFPYNTTATPYNTTTTHYNTTTPPLTTTSTAPSTTKESWQRTVILMERQTTDGHDLFIRGGIDHQNNPSCSHDALTSNCSIPVRHRINNQGQHYTKYNAWLVNDNYLDWYGAEPTQGTYNGIEASGTPAIWTTNDQNRDGYSEFNRYGNHYWLLDVDMDCSKTENGWFQIKGFIDGRWEDGIPSSVCTGAVSIPGRLSSTGNHWARCGMLNIYHFNQEGCEILPIPKQ